jgi:glutamate synthase (NADPH/NADH) large chain
VLNNLTRNPYAAGLAIDGEDAGPEPLQRVHEHDGPPHRQQHPGPYMNLVKVGKQNEIPLFAGGGIARTATSPPTPPP